MGLTLCLAGAVVIGICLAGAGWLNRPPVAISGPVDAIVVLGGDYPYRVLDAAVLYQQGRAAQVWITGDVPVPGKPFTTGRYSERLLWSQGVPRDRTLAVYSTSTWEDAEAVASLLEQRSARRVLFVTSWYHGRRAVCVFERFVDTFGYHPSEAYPHGPERWWGSPTGWLVVSRELSAVVYYWQRYGIAPWAC
jgi:uncharacterized SAM-binding protein YcdF (DUF218 family)